MKNTGDFFIHIPQMYAKLVYGTLVHIRNVGCAWVCVCVGGGGVGEEGGGYVCVCVCVCVCFCFYIF